MTQGVYCPMCGFDFQTGDSHEAFATLFEMNGDRADLNLACPDCGNGVETEVAFVSAPAKPEADDE